MKEYLKGHIKKEINDMKSILKAHRKSLKDLEGADLENTIYIIRINSSWADYDETSVKITHTGSLEDAIKKAQEDFKERNKRSDVQGRYQVHIKLSDILHTIPEAYWKRYI